VLSRVGEGGLLTAADAVNATPDPESAQESQDILEHGLAPASEADVAARLAGLRPRYAAVRAEEPAQERSLHPSRCSEHALRDPRCNGQAALSRSSGPRGCARPPAFRLGSEAPRTLLRPGSDCR